MRNGFGLTDQVTEDRQTYLCFAYFYIYLVYMYVSAYKYASGDFYCLQQKQNKSTNTWSH